MIYDVNNYGAAGDGSTNDTKAIQAAIDACAEAGGGRVLLTGGHTYRAGAIVLRSYVELHLEMGAVLKASDRLDDFNLLGQGPVQVAEITVPTYENCEYTGGPALNFIYAKDCEFVSITGSGKIDGNEEIFYGSVTPWHIDGGFYPRVPLLFLENVSHLTLRDVTLTGSGFWTTHLVGCKDVLIDGIRVLNNLKMANSDGIDPDHCQNVRIANCHIECADDCIVFKNTENAMQYGACENITVTGCTLISTSAAIKFGTESEAPFRNITVQNCNINRSNRGISLQLRDQGCIENVCFSNINIDTRQFSPDHWWGKSEPIAITAPRRKEDTKVGFIRNVIFENINCCSESGILLYGDDSVNIDNITFRNISLRLTRKTEWPKGVRDLRPCPGNIQEKGKVHAVFARNVKNISFDRFFSVVDESMQSFAGDPVVVADAENFVINDEIIG